MQIATLQLQVQLQVSLLQLQSREAAERTLMTSRAVLGVSRYVPIRDMQVRRCPPTESAD